MQRQLLRMVLFSLTLSVSSRAPAAAPKAVPTFECMGLYWSPAEGATANECVVVYRTAGTKQWRRALPLWFDARNSEYRGSIVSLRPGTVYEIKLTLLNTRTTVSFAARTWSEEFPVGNVVTLPEVSDKTLVAHKNGSPEGYVLYASAPGASATIDVKGKAKHCIEVRAHHVIIRALKLKNAGEHAIRIYPGSHDVVIEECDISGWGEPDRLEGEKWGSDYDAAVFSSERLGTGTVERIIVQRNRMHHPRYDTNSWHEYRKANDHGEGRWHPSGPQAVVFFNSAGNHVIRYNEVYSDEEHYFNDGFGAGSNYSACGFPNRDSDFYGNRISQCWDDAIESEGANCNVRIWGNYLDKVMVMIATAANSVGPSYIWRNVAGRTECGPPGTVEEHTRGPFLKAGSNEEFKGGRCYIFHNTLLQPPPPPGKQFPLGCGGGLTGSGGPLLNHVSRNNILQVIKDHWSSVSDRTNDPNNDFDYDLYNGKINAAPGHEKHGIRAKPKYDPNNRPDCFALVPGSPGHDAGVLIPNFNDDFTGAAPDMGAHEAGTPPMEFGVDAYRDRWRRHAARRGKKEKKAESSRKKTDPLIECAAEIAEARAEAAKGEFDRAARIVQGAAAKLGEEGTPLARVVRGFRAAGELRRWLAEGTAAGRHERVYVTLFGRSTRVKLVSAGDAGVVVKERGGKERPVGWRAITPEQLARMASVYAGPKGKPLPPERREALDDFRFACGIEQEAE